MKIRFAFLLLLVGATGMVSSCSKRPLNALNPCTINGVVQNVPVNPQRAVDLLFLIDDSTSMQDEQDKLQAQVPRLVNLLITGGQAEPAAVGEFPAVESLHVAIITPDLGYSTVPLTNFTPPQDFTPPGPPAECTSDGKAGFMQVDGNTGTPRQPCSAVTPPEGTLYLNFPEPGFNETDLISDVECLTGQDDGCGFEQQLEAILESDRNTANGGFNREDALLAIIMITDEDDCSSTDPRVFDTVITDGKLVERYVEEVAKLKSDPSQIVFAAITGIPEDPALDDENFETDEDRYAAILAHPDMVERKPDGAAGDSVGTQLVPACTADDGSGSAAPGRRIVETMEGLASGGSGVGTVVEAICADDYAPALNAIVERIAAALRQLCLPRPLNRDSANLVGCEVREVQPEGQTCADAGRGREPSPVGNEDGREVCRVTQLPSDPTAGIPSGEGWFYDDFTAETVNACSFNPEQQRVSFTSGAEPVSGARIRFECLQTAPPADADIGWPCINDSGCVTIECSADSDPDACMEAALNERYDRDNLMLACDPESNTCQLTCESDVQCPGGFACFDASGDGNQYCVNPTCTLN